MSSAQANHDPSLPHSQPSGLPPPSSAGVAGAAGPGEVPLGLGALDSSQIMSLLRHLPGVFNKLNEQGNLKEDAAQTLSNLSQGTFIAGQGPHTSHQLPQGSQQGQQQGPGSLNLPLQQSQIQPNSHYFRISDPGPSSHPRGPPNLGLGDMTGGMGSPDAVARAQAQGQEMEEGASDEDGGERTGGDPNGESTGNTTGGSTGRGRGGRSATMGSDEWSRQRKDNHKEVERRRRGNINEGINELGRIVPNGSGEKAKGAILSRAVQYIHHLKENEARNIEKWTLEKLLMDQAMGDLQGQLEEMRRCWDEERARRERAEGEVNVLRGLVGGRGFTEGQGESVKRGAEAEGHVEEENRDGKRQRVE